MVGVAVHGFAMCVLFIEVVLDALALLGVELCLCGNAWWALACDGVVEAQACAGEGGGDERAIGRGAVGDDVLEQFMAEQDCGGGAVVDVEGVGAVGGESFFVG